MSESSDTSKKTNGWFYPLLVILAMNALMAVQLEFVRHTKNVEVIVIKAATSVIFFPLIFAAVASAFPGCRNRTARCKFAFFGGALVLFSTVMQIGMVAHD